MGRYFFRLNGQTEMVAGMTPELAEKLAERYRARKTAKRLKKRARRARGEAFQPAPQSLSPFRPVRELDR